MPLFLSEKLQKMQFLPVSCLYPKIVSENLFFWSGIYQISIIFALEKHCKK